MVVRLSNPLQVNNQDAFEAARAAVPNQALELREHLAQITCCIIRVSAHAAQCDILPPNRSQHVRFSSAEGASGRQLLSIRTDLICTNLANAEICVMPAAHG